MRIFLPLLLFTVGCASSPPPPKAAEKPTEQPAKLDPAAEYALETCTGELDHDTWTLTCPQFVVSRTVIAWDDTWTEKLILNTTLATLREGAETVGTTSDRRPSANLNVHGGHGYAMKIETGVAEQKQTFGMTTFAQPLDESHVVGVICMDLESTQTERCEEISVWFATNLPEIEWVDLSQPMQFAGRHLSPPPGCEADGESTLVCSSGAEMLWFEREPDDGPNAHLDELGVVHEAIIKVNQERTGLRPTPTEQGFDCRLDGEVAECRQYRYDYGQNSLYVLVGFGKVRGIDVSLMCDWTSDVTDELPMPCSMLVDPTLPDTLTEEL